MTLRIGYLTDLHLRMNIPGHSPAPKRHCRRVAALLPRALERLRRAAPDLLVCTGDLVDAPTEAIVADRDAPGVEEDMRYVRQQLDRCGIPYIALPGNHDPLPDAFYRVFPRPPRVTRLNGCRVVSFHEDAYVGGEPPCTRSDEALGELAALFSAADDPARRTDSDTPEATVTLQHYTIYPDLNEGYPHNYGNDAEIRAAMEAAREPVVAICGHYHLGVPLVQENDVWYWGGKAFCEGVHPIYIIEISGDGVSIEAIEVGKAIQCP